MWSLPNDLKNGNANRQQPTANDFLLNMHGQTAGASPGTGTGVQVNLANGNRGNDLTTSLLFQTQQQAGLEGLLQGTPGQLQGTLGGLQQFQNRFQQQNPGGGTGSNPSKQENPLAYQDADPKVTVKCESCGVLLEVVVPKQHPSPSMIVCCGSCSSLLEVLLSKYTSQGMGIGGGAGNPLMMGSNGFPNLGNGGPYGLPGMAGFPAGGQLDGMSFLQQQASFGGQMQQQGSSSSLPFNQYNMLQHPQIAFDNLRSSGSEREEMLRKRNLQMLSSYSHPQGQQRAYLEEMPKGKRRKKDPNKPKKLSLYNKFVSQEVHRLKKSDEKLSYKDMFKIAAANWKTSPMNPNSKNHKPLSPGDALDCLDNLIAFKIHTQGSGEDASEDTPEEFSLKVELQYLN